MKEFTIEYYKKEDGSCPIIDLLDSLEKKLRAKTLRLQLILARNGNELREPYSKLLEDDIYELRVQQGNNIIRFLYFFMVDQKIVFTNGFVKKTQRTPKQAIELAKRYRKDYRERIGRKYE